jgi:hypothetical protein
MGIVRESIAFTREGPSAAGLGVGKSAIFPKVIDEITYDVLQDKDNSGPRSLADFSEKNIYVIDTRKLLKFYAENKDNSFLRDIFNSMMDKVLTFSPNKLEHHAAGWVHLFFLMGRQEEIWKNPKWINDNTFNEFRTFDLKRLSEETKKLGANKAFMLGSTRGERDLEIWGLQNGATNLDHTYNEPIQNACDRGDVELVKLLLASPIVDPGSNTKDGKRYKQDETNFCIRRAAKNGHLEVVKLLLNDKRVNPASRGNWALAAALSNGDLAMCKLLLTNQKVRDSIFNMKESAIKKFDNYRRTGEL